MPSLLTPEDSQRVADALIDKIAEADLDVGSAMREAVKNILLPSAFPAWKPDWLPLTIEHMCNQIAEGVTAAADKAADHQIKQSGRRRG